MRRKLITAGVILLGVLLLAIGVLYVYSGRIIESMKPRLLALASEKIGGEFTVGKTDVRLLPSPRIVVSDLSVNRPGLSVKTEQVDLSVALLPLLSKEVKISRLALTAPVISIEMGGEQRKITDASTKTAPQGDRAGADRPSAGGEGAVIELRELTIDDGKVSYLQAGLEAEVHELDVTTRVSATGSVAALSDLAVAAKVKRLVLGKGKQGNPESLEIRDEPFTVAADSVNVAADPLAVKFRGLAADALGIKVQSSGALSSDPGSKAEVTLEISSLEQLVLHIKRMVPAIEQYAPSGEAAFRGQVTYPEGISAQPAVDGTVTISNGAGSYEGLRLQNLRAKIGVKSLAQQISLAIDEAKGKLQGEGESGEILAAGQVKLMPVTGLVNVSSEALQVAALQPLIRKYAPDVTLDAKLAPKITLEFAPSGFQANGKVAVNQGSGTAKDVSFDGLSGVLNFRHQGKATALEIGDGAAAIEGQALSFSGAISLPEIKGNVNLKAQRLDLAQLGALASKFAPNQNIEGYRPSGIVSPDVHLVLEGGKPKTVNGTARLQDVSATVAGLTISSMNGTVTGDREKVKTDRLSLQIGGEPIDLSTEVALKAPDIDLTDLTVKGFNGTARLRGSLQGAQSVLRGNLDLTSMDVTALLKAFAPTLAPRITGTLQRVSAQFQCNTKDDALRTLSGNGRVEITDGAVKDINLGAVVLDKLGQVPLLAGLVLRRIPEKFQPYLASRDTPIRSLNATVQADRGVLSSRDFGLESDFYLIRGGGTADFDSKVDLGASIFFDPRFSEALIERVRELSALMNDRGSMVVPLTIRGTLPNVSVQPDVQQVSQRRVEREVRDKAGRAIQGLLQKGGSRGLDRLFGR